MLQISLTHAQTPIAPTYSPDNRVNTMLTMGDTVIIGGDFRHMGVYTGGGAAFPLGSNTPNLSFPKFIGSISASCPDGQGGVYVAGRFTKETEPSSNPINRIEHVRVDGSFNPDFSLEYEGGFGVQCLLFHQGVLYVGGWGLTAIEQQPAGNLAGIRISNKQLVTHLPALSANAKVDRLRVIGNSLYVMGSFTTIGNEARTNLAAIDLQDGSIKPWNPSAALTTSSQRGFVDVIPYQNRVIIGGNFSTGELITTFFHSAALVDTITGTNLQFLFRHGGGALTFGNNNCLYWASQITAMALDGDNLYTFSFGTFDTRVTAINLANHNTMNCTVRWTKYFNMIAKASDMFVHEGSLYIGGGSFTNLYRTNLPNEDSAFERQIKGLVRLNTATGDYQPWTADPVGLVWRDVRTMCRTGNQLFAGGTFSHVNGIDRAGIAMIRASTQQVLPFAPPPFFLHTIRSLKAMGNVLYAGGSFPWLSYTNKFGSSTDVPFDKSVVSFSLQTGEMQPFSVPAFERGGTVQALEADQVNLYVGGNFTEPVGNGRQHLIAVNRQSGAIQNWAPNPNFEVTALQITGNRLFAGGNFSNIAGQPRQRVAAFTLPALTLDSFRTGPDWGNVHAIRSVLGTLWLSGSFLQINNTNASLFAGINLTNGQLKNRPYPGFVGSWANALLSAGCKVIAAGNFTPNFNQPCNNLAVYDVFSQQLESACVSFESGSSIHALARIGNDVYLGGNFIRLNGKANATYFHRLRFPAGYFIGCASFVTQNAGKWHDPTTWRGGMVPPQDARVTVCHVVTVEQDVRCFSIQVQQGGNVSVNPGIKFEVVN